MTRQAQLTMMVREGQRRSTRPTSYGLTVHRRPIGIGTATNEPTDSPPGEYYGTINWHRAQTGGPVGTWNDTPLGGTTGYGGTSNGPYYGIAATAAIFHPGDVNQDGVVNGLDIADSASHWLQTGSFIPGDANGDRVVNGLDIALISSHWLQTYGGAGSAAAVPEPSALIIAAGSILALLAYRRWH